MTTIATSFPSEKTRGFLPYGGIAFLVTFFFPFVAFSDVATTTLLISVCGNGTVDGVEVCDTPPNTRPRPQGVCASRDARRLENIAEISSFSRSSERLATMETMSREIFVMQSVCKKLPQDQGPHHPHLLHRRVAPVVQGGSSLALSP
jgi:hypothetical protein